MDKRVSFAQDTGKKDRCPTKVKEMWNINLAHMWDAGNGLFSTSPSQFWLFEILIVFGILVNCTEINADGIIWDVIYGNGMESEF